MATILIDDGSASTQDFKPWTTTATDAGAALTSSAQSVFGSLRSIGASNGVNPNSLAAAFKAITGTNTGRGHVSLRMALLPATGTEFALLNKAGGISIGFAIDTTGHVFVQDSTFATLATGTKVLAINTDYDICVAWTITNATTFTIKVYVNGGAADITITNGGTVGTLPDEIEVGQCGGGSNGEIFYLADIYFENTYNSGNLLGDPATGRFKVRPLRVNANGTTNGFTTQVGSGGSGYGSGHSPQVNEVPLSETNGWAMVGAGAAITEEYNFEPISVGDADLIGGTIKDWMGWIWAKALVPETASLVVNGVNSNAALTGTSTFFSAFAASASYPAGTGADVGLITTTALTTVTLYETGGMVAYTPPAVALFGTPIPSLGAPFLTVPFGIGQSGPRFLNPFVPAFIQDAFTPATGTNTVTPVAANLLLTNSRTVTPVAANVLKTSSRTVTPVLANVLKVTTRTVTPAAANILKTNARTVTPIAANVLRVNSRTVTPIAANVLKAMPRTITPVLANVLKTASRTVSAVLANVLKITPRTVTPVAANVLKTNSRTVTPTAANVLRANARAVTPVLANILKMTSRTVTPVAANILKVTPRTVTPVLANLILIGITRTVTPVAANILKANSRTVTPVAANILKVATRSITPVAANVLRANARTITPVAANVLKTNARTVTPVAANILNVTTRTVTSVLANVLAPAGTFTRTVTPVAANVLKTSSRTVSSVAANLISTGTARTVTPAAANILKTNARTVTPVAANVLRGTSRTVTPAAANILKTNARTMTPAAANVLKTNARTVSPVRANLAQPVLATRTVAPVAANVMRTKARTVTQVRANLLAHIPFPDLGCVLWTMVGPFVWPPSGYRTQFVVMALPSGYIAVTSPVIASGYVGLPDGQPLPSAYVALPSETPPSAFIPTPDGATLADGVQPRRPPPSGFIV